MFSLQRAKKKQRTEEKYSVDCTISNRDRHSNFAVFRVARQTCAMTSLLLIRNRPSDRQYFVKSRTTFAFKDLMNHWVMQLAIRLAVGSVRNRCTKQEIHRSTLEVIFNSRHTDTVKLWNSLRSTKQFCGWDWSQSTKTSFDLKVITLHVHEWRDSVSSSRAIE